MKRSTETDERKGDIVAKTKIEKVPRNQHAIAPLLGLDSGNTFEYKGVLCIKTDKVEANTKLLCVVLTDGHAFMLDEEDMVVTTKATIKYETMGVTKQ